MTLDLKMMQWCAQLLQIFCCFIYVLFPPPSLFHFLVSHLLFSMLVESVMASSVVVLFFLSSFKHRLSSFTLCFHPICFNRVGNQCNEQGCRFSVIFGLIRYVDILYFLLFHLSLSELSVSFCVHFLCDGTHT